MSSRIGWYWVTARRFFGEMGGHKEIKCEVDKHRVDQNSDLLAH
jgi:hypothetical protein